MRSRAPLLFVAFMLAMVAGPSVARAQDSLAADVPFTFVAAGAPHGPGRYELRINEDQMSLSLVPAKGAARPVLSITRLAAPVAPAADGRLVFDKVGDTYYLAEAWFPGEDGFVLHLTKEKHTHQAVKLHKKNA
jgi:hypothetical protein